MDFKTVFILIFAIALISGAYKAYSFLKNKQKRQIFTDPLYLIIIGGEILITLILLFFSIIFLPIGIIVILITHMLIIKLTDEDYDIEKDVNKSFRVLKKCPRCMKSLPSYFTTKCPHCTADL